MIKNILNQKIIIYDYPTKKIGIIKGIYYKGKFYSLNDENLDITDKESPSTYKYEKSYLYYEYSGLIIKIKKKIKYTKINENIKRLEITKIENGIGELYEYIPIEFTSLNIQKEDESAHILINEIDKIKLFYEKYHKKEVVKDIKLKFMCTLFSGPLIINTKKNEKFSNIEQKLIDENKVLENKKLIFVSNAIQLDRLKTVKENNLFDNSIIFIINFFK